MRALTAVCKDGADRDRDLSRLDADVEHINVAIAQSSADFSRQKKKKKKKKKKNFRRSAFHTFAKFPCDKRTSCLRSVMACELR